MKKVGILGGGQLGLLLAQSLARLGAQTIIYDPDANAPACHHTSRVYSKGWLDKQALEKFFDECDVVTYEFENVESDLLFDLERRSHQKLCPSASVLYTTQDRSREKEFLRKNNLPHANFLSVGSWEDLVAKNAELFYPCIVKTAFGGYDGKGQHFVRNSKELLLLCEQEKNKKSPSGGSAPKLVVEEVVGIAIEVSCIVARGADGTEITFPIFENIHRDHILDFTLVPARIPEEVALVVRKIALQAARELKALGLLTTEFFLSRQKPASTCVAEVSGWFVMINEFAPRPHNSGHVTMESCQISQFDALARVLVGNPLVSPEVVSDQTFCMGNLLGDVWLAQDHKANPGQPARQSIQDPLLDVRCLKDFPAVSNIVVYGKNEARAKRKMGHFIARADSPDEALKLAEQFRNKLRTYNPLR